jgi:hypothetical protein
VTQCACCSNLTVAVGNNAFRRQSISGDGNRKGEGPQRRVVIRFIRGNMPGIHSESVILIEGNADEIGPDTTMAAEMHGFVIMVPPGEGSEWFLDLLWRITMLYAGRPSWLRSRSRVAKMVEAVMSKESREPTPARSQARKRGQTDRAQRDDSVLSKALARPGSAPNTELRSPIASLPPLRDRNKAKTRK